MTEENKTSLENLITKVDEHIVTNHRRQYESQIRYHHKQSALLKRRHREHMKVLSGLASETGLDLEQYEEEHRKGLEARIKWAGEESKRLDSVISKRRSETRKLRAHVQRNANLLNRTAKNPGTFVCMGFASGTQSDNVSIEGNFTSNITHQFTPNQWRNVLDLNVELESQETHSMFYYKHWMHFIWESGPSDPGLAYVSGWIELDGQLEAHAADDCNPFRVRAHVTTLDVFMMVSQDTNQGLVFFPEKRERIVAIDLNEGQSDVQGFSDEFSLAYHEDIPLAPNAPVVVSFGVQFGGAMAESDTAKMDFMSGNKRLEIPFVVIKHES